MKRLMEEVSEFGIPGLEEARVNWKGLCQKLLAAAEMHMMIMAGEAEDEEDPLPSTIEEVKAAMEPQEEPKAEGPETEEEAEEEEAEEEDEEEEAEEAEEEQVEESAPVTEMATARSTIKKYEALKDKKMWTKQEILGVAHRMSDLDRGYKKDSMDEEFKYILHELIGMFDEGKTVDISSDQSAQGIAWLKKNVINAKGELRDTGMVREAGFGQDEANVIKNFKKFELVGFKHDEQAHIYTPIYRTIAADGSSFDYSVGGGWGGASIEIHR